MKKLFFYAFCISLVFFSCQKDDSKVQEEILSQQRSGLPDVVDLLNLLTTPTDGYIVISCNGTLGSQSSQALYTNLGAEFFDKNGSYADYGALSIADYNMVAENPESNIFYFKQGVDNLADVFGTELSLKLSGKGELPGFSKVIHTPKAVQVSSPEFSNEIKFEIGSEITWNADQTNELGFGILVRYDPRNPSNKGQSFFGEGDSIDRFIHTEDDGSYTLTESDLAGIPNGARASVVVGRGSYDLEEVEGGYSFGIASASAIDIPFLRN